MEAGSPEFIFLDEATNALDANNEREIMEQLHAFYKGRTVVVALLVGSCFFKYPDVITAEMTLTGQHPATAVVTRAAGKIQELLARDNRPVKERDWLAVIENHANTKDAIYRDKALERSGVDVDSLDKALSQYKELSLEGAAASAENLRIQIGEQEQSLLDLTLEQNEREFTLGQELQTAREQLLNSMNEWRLRYCLIAPIEGVVTFTNYWNENQYIPSGEVAFTVVPQGESRLMGKVRIPIARSGKVKRGQRAIVRFSNFPDQEFGVVNGVVSNISLVPTDEFYTADIDFPEGLRSNYGIDLPVSPETQASAEIVTEELRLIERFFLPIKRIVKEGF